MEAPLGTPAVLQEAYEFVARALSLADIIRRRPPRRNTARDKWVAGQRAKKPAPTWEEIYDRLTEVAEKKGWRVPANPKSLSEAYYRYLKNERQ
jgi:hypothetical protein